MTEREIKKELDSARCINKKYMAGTEAYHMLGNLSRLHFDLFRAYGETDNYWIGAWVTGFGFFDVCFPKKSSRDLTDDEVDMYNGMAVQIGGQYPFKLIIKKQLPNP